MELEEDDDGGRQERHGDEREQDERAALVALQKPEERGKAKVRGPNKMRHKVCDEKKRAYYGQANGDIPLAPWGERDPPLEGSNDDLESEDKLDVGYEEDGYRVRGLVSAAMPSDCTFNPRPETCWKLQLGGRTW